jgi:hypothetical protein
MVLESISFLFRRKISILHPRIHIAIRNMHTGKKSNMHIAQKLSPTPKSKWTFQFKHTLAALATAAPPPAAAEAVADGEAMVVDMTAETEAANGAHNNQPKGSNSSRNGSQGKNGDGSSCGRGAYNNQPKSGSISSRNGGRGGGEGGSCGSHGRGKDSGRGGGSNIPPTVLATMGEGNGGGRQQSTKKR